jgi:uncharacterized membrane protein
MTETGDKLDRLENSLAEMKRQLTEIENAVSQLRQKNSLDQLQQGQAYEKPAASPPVNCQPPLLAGIKSPACPPVVPPVIIPVAQPISQDVPTQKPSVKPQAGQAVPAPVPAPAAAPAPEQSLEQIIGLKWMLVAGVVLVVLAGGYFCKLAYDVGWLTPGRIMTIGAAFGLLMIGMGEWSLRRQMRLFAAALIGVGLAWLYMVVWTASPNGIYAPLHVIDSMPVSFALMCAVTLLGMALAIQTNILPAGIISLTGAFVSPVLLSTGANQQVALMCYLLVVSAGFLTVAYMKRWSVLGVLSLLGCGTLFAAWAIKFYDAPAFAQTCAFAWALLAVHAAWSLASEAKHRGMVGHGRTVLLLGCEMLAVMLMLIATQRGMMNAYCLQLLALLLAVIAYCAWRKAPAVATLFTLATLAVFWGWVFVQGGGQLATSACAYGWCFFAAGLAVTTLPVFRSKVNFQALLLTAMSLAMAGAWGNLLGGLSPTWLMIQLVVLNVIVLVVCQWREWHWLRAVAAGWTIALVFHAHGDGRAEGLCLSGFTVLWSWVFYGLVLADIIQRAWRSRPGVPKLEAGLLTAMSVAMAVGWWHLIAWMNPAGLMAQLLILDVLVLAMCQWQRWHWLRAGLVAWTAALLILPHFNHEVRELYSIWFSTAWAWTFYAIIISDILLRVRRKLSESAWLDACIGFFATACMFAGTYIMLNRQYDQWMGLYTTVLSACLIGLVWLIYRLGAGRLASAFLIQALVLLTLACPIQFDNSQVTIGWLVLGTAGLALARLTNRKLLWLYAPLALALASIHFACLDLTGDARLSQAAFVLLDTPITFGLLLAIGVSAGWLISAGILRWGKCIWNEISDLSLAVPMVLIALGFYIIRTAIELPAIPTSYCWLVLGSGLAYLAARQKSLWLVAFAGILLLATAGKYVDYDTLYLRMNHLAGMDQMVVVNWQCLLGVLMTFVTLGYFRLFRRAGFHMPEGLITGLTMFGVLLILWAGSFEIDRFFYGSTHADTHQRMQASLSVWWSICAIAMLAGGFWIKNAPARYTALAIFGVTVVKILAVDLSRYHMAYRVVTLMGVGLLLLVGSWIYHKRFKPKKTAAGEPAEVAKDE